MLNIDVEKILHTYNVVIKQRQGDEIRCLCPFHEDKKISFSINKSTGMWICFANCGEGGIISLVAKFENCSYDDAKQKISKESFSENKKYAILNAIENKTSVLKNPLFKNDLPYIDLPTSFEYIESTNNCPKYLLSRLKLETIMFFNLGFCTKGMYKDMIIIPVAYNNTVYGFQGRNTQHTDSDTRQYKMPWGFEIKKFLYNYDNAKHYSTVFVTEGAFSAMSMHEKGFKNVISTFSASHINVSQFRFLISSNIKRLIFCYDSDIAGKKGVKKNYQLYKNYFRIDYVEFPSGKDPNDLSKEQLHYLFRNRINRGSDD